MVSNLTEDLQASQKKKKEKPEEKPRSLELHYLLFSMRTLLVCIASLKPGKELVSNRFSFK